MSAVVEAIEGVVDFAGNVVESVLDDPLTAIATAAAFSFGIPFIGLGSGALAAGVANTAAGLVQGEDFDEALKGGVMAGVGSWAGQQVAGYFGGSAADDVAGAAAKNAVASSGDEAAAALASSGDDVGTALASSGDDVGTALASSGDEIVTAGLGDDVVGAGLGDDVAGAGLGDDVAQAWDDTLMSPGKAAFRDASVASNANVAPVKILDADKFTSAAGKVVEGAGTVNNSVLGSPMLTKGTNVLGDYVDDAASFLDEAAGVAPKPLDVYNKITQQPSKNIFEKGWDSLVREGQRDWSKVKDIASGYIDDAADVGDWVGENLGKTTTGVVATGALINSLNDKKDDEEEQLNKEQQQMRKEMAKAEKRYNEPLPQYKLKRDLYAPTISIEDLYKYGEDPSGEYKYFSNSVYEPYSEYGSYSSYEPYTGYQEGGSVMPQAPSKMNPAFAFYKYGNVPETVRRYEGGGYAHGGSRGDGRSDHIEALLSPGEFVMDAETVSMLGNGSSEAGARRLEEMRQAVRKQKGGALSKGKFSPDAKSPLAYLSKKR